jgi:hypothetical protein
VIIVHKEWQVQEVVRDTSGSLVGVVAARGGFEVLLVSAYLPTNLDQYGCPLEWDIDNPDRMSASQAEAHAIYSTLFEWTNRNPNWLIAGDLNETRSLLDSKRVSELKRVPKFVDNFLDESMGVDIWRTLHPHSPGFTYKGSSASSRLDYFLVSPLFFHIFHSPKMRIANWRAQLDHACISLLSSIPSQGSRESPSGRPWSIPQPRLFNLCESNRELCKNAVSRPLLELLQSFEGGSPESFDEFSKSTARIIVEQVGHVLGLKSDSRNKGKYSPTDVCRVKGIFAKPGI